jgi:hypothetical protein
LLSAAKMSLTLLRPNLIGIATSPKRRGLAGCRSRWHSRERRHLGAIDGPSPRSQERLKFGEPSPNIRRENLGLDLTLISCSPYFPEDSERRNFSDFEENSQYSGLG